MKILGIRRLLVAVVSLVAFLATDARAVIVLESVDWTQQGAIPTSLLGGSWSFGNVTGTTGAIHNAGQVFPANWGGLPFGVGYTTSINEGVALGVTTGTQQQTFSFSAPISSLYLFFNYTDANTSFDFGSYNWTLVGANNASRSGSSVVIAPTTGDSEQDGFLININETFGPGNGLVFDFVNSGVSGYQTVAFNLGQGAPAGVPEIDPAGMGSVLALVTGALGLLERRRSRR